CAGLEHGFSGVQLRRMIGDWTHRDYPLLVPRPAGYPVTVRDVADAAERSRADIVERWAVSAWTAWSAHHETIRGWLAASLKATP
ncbi:MAG: hypothetical protein LBI49_11245, partial [Nocardiopsaceae bacterium]|nr:hypothetical protein [Nocardiopsaceae bacterium]